jgi:hypothetical protein
MLFSCPAAAAAAAAPPLAGGQGGHRPGRAEERDGAQLGGAQQA